jgi:hypothetical protein
MKTINICLYEIFKQDFLKLELKMAETKTDLLKSFIGGFITIIVMIVGLFAAIILK